MMNIKSPVVLRPHHLLCIKFFVGRGYSEEFTANMYKTIADLNESDSVKIAFSADVLCAACPNFLGKTCKTQEKVCRYDKKTAELLQLDDGKTYSYKELKARLEEKIFSQNKFDDVCRDCEWANICHK